jgi:hypothetical protein
MNEKQYECTIEARDIFNFIANNVGMTVIHPGGFEKNTGGSRGRSG